MKVLYALILSTTKYWVSLKFDPQNSGLSRHFQHRCQNSGLFSSTVQCESPPSLTVL